MTKYCYIYNWLNWDLGSKWLYWRIGSKKQQAFSLEVFRAPKILVSNSIRPGHNGTQTMRGASVKDTKAWHKEGHGMCQPWHRPALIAHENISWKYITYWTWKYILIGLSRCGIILLLQRAYVCYFNWECGYNYYTTVTSFSLALTVNSWDQPIYALRLPVYRRVTHRKLFSVISYYFKNWKSWPFG